MIQNSMDMNMLNLKDEAKELSIKHGLSEEALLIEQEEHRLNQLLSEQARAFGIVEYMPEHNLQSNMSTLKRTNSGNHLISN